MMKEKSKREIVIYMYMCVYTSLFPPLRHREKAREGIEQLNRKRHNGLGWLWRRVIKWVPHSHTAV